MPQTHSHTKQTHTHRHIHTQTQTDTHTHTHSNMILHTHFFHTLGNKQDNEQSKVDARTLDNIVKLYINNKLYVIVKLSG